MNSVFYFALASWWQKPLVPPGASGFSYHKRNGYAGVLYALVPLTLVELLVVDLIVRVHHPTTANVLLVVDLFMVLSLLGLARSVQLRPIVVSMTEIQVRNGVQWRLDIPRAVIEKIDFGKLTAPKKGTSGYLRAAPGNPNAMLTLRQPVRAYGPYGLTRDVTRVGLVIDDLAGFERALAEPIERDR